MSGIFIAKLKWLYRDPWTFILMTFMSILFALIIGGDSFAKVTVPALAEDEQVKDIVNMLEDQNVFEIEWVLDKNELDKKISSGKREFGLLLRQDNFKIIVGINSPNVNLLEQSVENAYIKKKQINELEVVLHQNNLKKELSTNPVFQLKSESFHGKNAFIYDGNLHPLFGFSLFFVIYTVAYSVFQIVMEKNNGLWDRMILSPVRKWEMYVANFLYSFFIGYSQVLIVFLVFRYIVKINFHGAFWQMAISLIPYVLSIVALSILITGFVKTIQQFNAVIPIVSLGSAMLGGAFWPLEIVESKFMLTLSKFMPITYGMEVLNGAIYGYSFEQILYPVSILLLMTVLLTGLGIHLMEKRYIS